MRQLGRAVVLLSVLAACGDDGGDGDDAGVDGSRIDAGGDDAARGDGGSFGYCPGEMPGTDACRTDVDCECGDCVAGPICGGTGCAAECGSDADCDGGICLGGCCPYCAPPCPMTACAEGSRCNTSTGRCDPIHCSEGMACPTNTRCTPGAPGNGCVRLTCGADGDCDCGTCAEGRCWDRPGQCCPPLPG